MNNSLKIFNNNNNNNNNINNNNNEKIKESLIQKEK